LVVVVAAGEFGAEVEEAPWAREIEIRDPDGSKVRVATPRIERREAVLPVPAQPRRCEVIGEVSHPAPLPCLP
jgi:hypothetical protein